MMSAIMAFTPVCERPPRADPKTTMANRVYTARFPPGLPGFEDDGATRPEAPDDVGFEIIVPL